MVDFLYRGGTQMKILDAGDARFYVRDKTLDWENIDEYKGGHWAACDHRSTDRWLDAGGHIGTFAVYVSPRSEYVVTVEPDKGNHQMLLNNLQLNDVHNVTVVRAALVGNQDEEREFYLNTRRNRGTHTFFRRGHFVPTKVPCVNINDVLRQHKINCIEMDVEGAELELLYAVENWEPIRQLYLEYHDHILGRDGLEGVIEFLSGHFDTVTIDPTIRHKWWRIVIARKGQ